jgi:nucleoside-diphosphate-sugar epimerase
MKILVIGGTLFVGQRLVSELLKEDHAVTILHRKPKHALGRRVENLVADRNDATQLRAALEGRRFDVVFDNVYDWERGTTAAQVEATVKSLNDRLTRYVFLSSVAAYGDGLNHYEDDALAPDDHPDPYVRNKAMTERMLFRTQQRTGLPVVTFRPPFLYGPENPFYREAFFWDRMRADRTIVLPGDGGRLMQFAYIKDLVTAMIRCMSDPAAVGQSFNIGNDRPVTQLELVNLFAKTCKKKPLIARVPRDRIVEAGGNPMGQPAYFGVYFDLPPITEAVGKIKRVLKMQLTPFEDGLAETYAWYLRHHKAEKLDTVFEDRLIALASQIAN